MNVRHAGPDRLRPELAVMVKSRHLCILGCHEPQSLERLADTDRSSKCLDPPWPSLHSSSSRFCPVIAATARQEAVHAARRRVAQNKHTDKRFWRGQCSRPNDRLQRSQHTLADGALDRLMIASKHAYREHGPRGESNDIVQPDRMVAIRQETLQLNKGLMSVIKLWLVQEKATARVRGAFEKIRAGAESLVQDIGCDAYQHVSSMSSKTKA